MKMFLFAFHADFIYLNRAKLSILNMPNPESMVFSLLVQMLSKIVKRSIFIENIPISLMHNSYLQSAIYSLRIYDKADVSSIISPGLQKAKL